MLNISFKNWKKENNQGLCDLVQIEKQEPKKFTITSTGVVYRNLQNFDLMFVSEKNLPQKGMINQFQPIFFIKEHDRRFKITDIKKENGLGEPLTCIVSSNNPISINFSQNLCLKQGSVIKIGKATVQTIKIKVNFVGGSQNLYQHNTKPFVQKTKQIGWQNYQFQNEKAQKKSKICNYNISRLQLQKKNDDVDNSKFSMFEQNPTCKICYSKTITPQNLLVSICKCSGSSKFIHQECLKKWVYQKSCLTKLQKLQKQVYMAQLKGFQCQICKQFYCDNEICNLLFSNNQNKFQKYMCLGVKHDNRNLLYFVNLQKNQQINIGRDSSNDIVLHQLTASRFHCTIKCNRNKIEIVDLGSKFGTCVKMPSFVINKQNQMYCLQKGRTYLQINKMKDKTRHFFKKLLMCYQDIN